MRLSRLGSKLSFPTRVASLDLAKPTFRFRSSWRATSGAITKFRGVISAASRSRPRRSGLRAGGRRGGRLRGGGGRGRRIVDGGVRGYRLECVERLLRARHRLAVHAIGDFVALARGVSVAL